MSQYINLFNPALQKHRDALSSRVLLSATIAAMLVVGAAAFGAQYRAIDLERQVVEGEVQLKVERDKLVSLAKSNGERKTSPKLIDELARAESLLKTRNDLIQVVESGGVGRIDGFSEQLRAFARQSMNGLWLTGFSIGAGGSELEIVGRTLNAELLPTYIRRLNSEQAFQGKSFAMLDVTRVEADSKTDSNTKTEKTVTAADHRQPSQLAFSLAAKMRNVDVAGHP